MGRIRLIELTTGALLALAIGCSASLAGEPVTLPGTEQHDLRAEPNGRAYRVFVGLPPGYDPNGSERYPVTYVLDGNVVFPLAVNMLRMFALFRESPQMIVVGIGYPVQFFPETIGARYHDLTPTHREELDREQSARFGFDVRSGGAAEFLRFLREEAIPFVDANYRTTGANALWGHSLGGLFALYTLFESPELFQRYGISSPSLNFSAEAVFAQEAAYADEHRALPARVFVSLGSEENDLSMPTATLIDLLQKREYEDFVLESQVFQDETHVSVFPAAFTRGLRFLYAAPATEPETEALSPAGSERGAY